MYEKNLIISLFLVISFFTTENTIFSQDYTFMDYFISYRLSSPVVHAQKQAIDFMLLNQKDSLHNEEYATLCYYSGICEFIMKNYEAAKKYLQKSMRLSKSQKYKFYYELVINISNNRKQEKIENLLLNNMKYAKTAFCRLGAPDYLKHIFNNRKKLPFENNIEKIYFQLNMVGSIKSIEKSRLHITSQETIHNFKIYDPFLLLYLYKIYKHKQGKILKTKLPDKNTDSKNDFYYVYINSVLPQKQLSEKMQSFLIQKHKRLKKLPIQILDAFFILSSKNPDYMRAHSVLSQYVINNPLREKTDPNKPRILYYIDYTISSYYVHDLNWAYQWILTNRALEKRYNFLEVSNYYMSNFLYK